MSENKTKPTEVAVEAFLDGLPVAQRAADARVLITMMQAISGEPPVMWGPSIIGFGTHHYRYESGREGDMPAIAFAPRKAELVLYVRAGRPGAAPFLAQLGKHKTGKGCLYIKKLADIDLAVLEAMVRDSFLTLNDPQAAD